MNKSIELCNISSSEAVDVVVGKLRDPALTITLGGTAVARINSAEHIGDDGLIVVRWRDIENNAHAFQFAPTFEPFSRTASGEDGKPVCTGCNDEE